MKNLIGYLNKTVSIFSLLILFVAFKSPTYAQSGFNISTDFTHTIEDVEVSTEVLITISADIDRVLTYYTATIPIEDLNVDCFDQQGDSIECSTYDNNNATDILIDLNNAVVRADNPTKLVLRYKTQPQDSNSYTISSYIQDTTTNSVSISYPKEKGEPLWASDTIQNLKGSSDKYTITIQKPTSKSTSLIFGNSVTYQFNISKILNNSLTGQNQTFEIIIPPDTHNQTIIFDKIDPLPNVSIQDVNSNYILKYIVQPNESINLKITGHIQMHHSTAAENINSTSLTETPGYWDITNTSEVKRVRSFLIQNNVDTPPNFSDINDIENSNTKSLIYKYLNQYIIERLNIKDNTDLEINNSIRLGANNLVEQASEATSEDYADFTVAIFRMFNIPTRMKIGYVSNISGYNADGFYHAWAEFYDSENKTWETLDPFLEEYTDKTLYGSDFFDHITIINRETSPVSPNLTFYTANDFVVKSETTSSVTPSLSLDSNMIFEDDNIVNKYIGGSISFKNTGNVAITGYEILKSNISVQEYIDPVENMNSQIVLPGQTTEISLNIPSEEKQESIFINASLKNKNYLTKEILLEEDIYTEPIFYLSILSKLISLFIGGILIFLIYSVIQKGRKVLKYE